MPERHYVVYRMAAHLQLGVPKRFLEAPQCDAPHHVSGRQRCSGQLSDVVKLDAAGQNNTSPSATALEFVMYPADTCMRHGPSKHRDEHH